MHFGQPRSADYVKAYQCNVCSGTGAVTMLTNNLCPVCSGTVDDQYMGVLINEPFSFLDWVQGKPRLGKWKLVARNVKDVCTPPPKHQTNALPIIAFEDFFRGLQQTTTRNKGSNHHAVGSYSVQGPNRHHLVGRFCKHRYAITRTGLMHHCPVTKSTQVLRTDEIYGYVIISSDGLPSLEFSDNSESSKLLSIAFNVGGRYSYQESIQALTKWRLYTVVHPTLDL